MATNNLNLTAADSGKVFPLRGDMGVALNFTPPNNNFRIGFMTQDAGTFIIGSGTRMFRALNAAPQSSLSVGGKIGLFIELMYDTDKNEFVVTKNNLVAGEATGGTGGTGTAATITVAQTVTGAPGTAALVENIGTSSAVQLKFTIPQGAAGANATGGTGTALPNGGTTAQYLGKISDADGQVGWLTLPAGGTPGTGTGTGYTAEVVLTPNASNEVTPDKALGTSFRVVLKPGAEVKINNPIGFVAGEHLSLVLVQPPEVVGTPFVPGTAGWGLNWAHPNRQPPTLASTPNGINKASALLTAGASWLTDVTPDGTKTLGYGAAAFIARNVTTGVSYYVLRNATLPSAMTAMKPGETLKILRNGLGIEAYGGIDGTNGAGNFLITGALPNGNRAELRTGPGVRSAYDKGVLAFSAGNVTAQDIIVSGAREQSGTAHIAQGVSVSGTANVTLKNVKIYDNENGILSANNYTGTLTLEDVEFDGNAVGADYGFVHNIYMGHHLQGWYATRCTFKNAVGGHNIKCRAGDMVLRQVHCYNSIASRELDKPNGGKIDAADSIFEHLASSVQNDCVRIAAEAVDTSRPRSYVFRNCHFYNGKPAVNMATYVWNDDPDVDVYLIDCTFEGATQWAGSDANGNRGRVIVQFTPGVTPGPRAPVGYQPLAVTPVAG